MLNFQAVRLASRATQQINAIVKKMGMERVQEAFTSQESFQSFSTEVFEQLTPDLKRDLPLDRFLAVLEDKRKAALKSKKNRQLIKKTA